MKWNPVLEQYEEASERQIYQLSDEGALHTSLYYKRFSEAFDRKICDCLDNNSYLALP